MLIYISLPGWSNIKLCTMVDRERFSLFRVDHWVQKSGHPCSAMLTRTEIQEINHELISIERHLFVSQRTNMITLVP
jgi:hypothetical protein